MRRWLLTLLLLPGALVGAQTPVPVTFVWNLPTPEFFVTAEFERDGALQACGPITVVGDDYRCSATVLPGTATFRLRGRNAEAREGPWSDAVTATVPGGGGQSPPGPFTITWSHVPPLTIPSEGAVPTFDSAAQNSSGSAASLTVSHTLGGGANRAVYAFVHGADKTFTATYNGVSMTELYDGTPGSPFKHIAVYRILEANLPAAGTYNVVFTPSANNSMAGGVVSFSDVDQTTPNRTASLGTGSGSTSSVAPTSSVGDVVLDLVTQNSDTTGTAGSGQTARVNVANGDNFVAAHASTEPGAASSTTMTWTLGGGGAWVAWAAAITPASTPTAAAWLPARVSPGQRANLRR